MAALATSSSGSPSATVSTLVLVTVFQLSSAAPWKQEQLWRREQEETARAWAPLVWLHSSEHFYPDDVHTFLQHVTPSPPGDGPPITVKEGSSTITLPPLPTGKNSWDSFLLAHFDQECSSNCHLPKFMYGKKPSPSSSPSVYAVVHTCQSSFPKVSRRMAVETEELLPRLSDDSFAADSYVSIDIAEHIVPIPSSVLTPPPIPAAATTPSVPTEIPFLPASPLSRRRSILADSHHLNGNININSDGNDEDTMTSEPTIDNSNDHRLIPMLRMPADEETPEPDVYLSSLGETHSDAPIDPTEEPVSHPYSTSASNQPIDEHDSNKRRRDLDSGRNQVFTVTYWMFYPYNYGKDVCTLNLGYYFGRMYKPTVNGTCYGDVVAMGNHVGDWEHVSIQFKGNTPINMYVSSHNFGAFYKYDAHKRHFAYYGQDTRKGIPMSPDYPPIISLRDTHPILYSALGSHGLWGASGSHQYSAFPKLHDQTGEGTEWQTWLNLDVIDWKDHLTQSRPHRRWLTYEGRWGNPKSRCHTLMAGFCELNHGPTGIPRKRINFPCPRSS